MDLQKFTDAQLAPREADIAVPELAEFFGEPEKDEEGNTKPPVWRVRGLTGAELGRCNEMAEKGADNVRALVRALAGDGDKAASIRQTVGLDDESVPTDVSRRIEMLAIGSLSPAIGRDQRDIAVKLSEGYPTTFYNLTNRILSLTGQGAEVGKQKRSGKTRTSG